MMPERHRSIEIILIGIVLFILVLTFIPLGTVSLDEDNPMGFPAVDQEQINLSVESETTLTSIVGGHNRNPVIMKDAVGSFFVVWEHSDGGENDSHEIMISTSGRWGMPFGAPSKLDLGNPESGKEELVAAVAMGTNRYYLSWRESEESGRSTVFMASSLDKGSSFKRSSEVTPEFSNATHPRISSSPDGRVFIAFLGWHNDTKTMQVFMRYTDDDGSGFSEAIMISDPDLTECQSPWTYLDDLNIYCAWECGERIYVTKSDCNNVDFIKAKKVDSLDNPSMPHPYSGPYSLEKPSIHGNGQGDMYALWSDNREGENKQFVFWAQSFDHGDNFFKQVYPPVLHNQRKEQTDASLNFAPDGDIYLTYRNGYSLHLLRANSGEVAFAQEMTVKEGNRKKGAARIAASDEGCYVVYDMAGSSADTREVILAKVIEEEKPKKPPPNNSSVRSGVVKLIVENWEWMIPILILLILIFVIVRTRRQKGDPSGKTDGANVNTAKPGETTDGKKNKGRTKRKNSQDPFDEPHLKRELDEKRSAMKMLKEERREGAITKVDYLHLKEVYERDIRGLERKLSD